MSQHGKGIRVLFNQYDMSQFLNQADASTTVDTAEDTSFGDTWKSYIAGLHDGTLSLSGFFDAVANGVDATFQAALGTGSTLVSVLWTGNTVPGRGVLTRAIQTSYDVSAPVGDVVSAAAEIQADGGVWHADVLLGGPAVTATGNASSADNGVATSDGWVANLHVTAMSGTTPNFTFKIADSADNSTFADLSGGGFTALTTIGSQQISGTGQVRRYARAAYTVTGTTPSCTPTMTLARK
jgi:hypothetical protein